MAERNGTGRVWTMRVTFVALCALILFAHLIPMDTKPGHWPGPDLMAALVMTWALRRPSFVPVLLVAFVFLLADLMFQRPPGLWAALMVGAVEWLKSRARQTRDSPWTVELMLALAAYITISVMYRVVLLILFVPLPTLSLVLIEVIFTAAALPIVMLASRLLFGLHRAAPGEVDSLGHRI